MTKKSPFDSFNTQVRGVNRGADPHLPLWKAWNDNDRSEEHLEPLMDAMEPTIKSHAKKTHSGLGGSIPYAALEAKYRSSAKKSLDNFKPEGGTKVRNWVLTGFRRTTDFVDQNRNFAAVPGSRVGMYQRYQNAKNEFLTTHGHEPSFEDMKVLMPDVPEHHLRPLMQEFRRELYIGGSPDPESNDDSSLGHSPSEVRTILSLMPALLTPDEHKVFKELKLIGPAEPKKVDVESVAKKTGFTVNQVYRLRASIYEKAKPHLRDV